MQNASASHASLRSRSVVASQTRSAPARGLTNCRRERLREGQVTRSASPPRRGSGQSCDPARCHSTADGSRGGPRRRGSGQSCYAARSHPTADSGSGGTDTLAPALAYLAGGSALSAEPTPRTADGSTPLHHSSLALTPDSVPRTRHHRVDVSEYLDPGEVGPLLDLAPGQRSIEDPRTSH